MRNTLLDDNDSDTSLSNFDMGLDTTHIISDTRHSKEASFIKKVELKPTEQQRIPLGSFKGNNPPKGFSIELTPDPNPEGSVVTEVASLGTSKQYKLVLQHCKLWNQYGER